MDRPPSPLFRPVAVEAASGTQIGASLTTHWRGVTAFTAVAFVLLAALIAFVAIVEHSPVHRVAAFVDARSTPVAGQPLSTIAPPEDSLVVKLLVTPAAIASVRAGAAFRLAFRAYPQERFGLFDAKVESVDEVSSPPGQVLQDSVDAKEHAFVVTASLPGGGLRGGEGELLPLRPGMRADALVPSERRSVLAWLLDPRRLRLDDSVGPGRAVAEARR